MNEADHLENENKSFFVSCTDENANKIYEDRKNKNKTKQKQNPKPSHITKLPLFINM
jgi:hypothetical protein